MNPSELAKLMLKWEKVHQRERSLAQRIERAVLAEEESVTVGNVYARYTRGRTTYDYQKAGTGASEEVIGKHTKTVTNTDWRAVCQDAKLEPPVSRKGVPSVNVRIKG